MLIPILWGAPAHADPVDAQVARGWYLWQTGQDQVAAKVAAEAAAAAPTSLAAINVHIAMEVAQGNGFSVESAYRESWAEGSDDPVQRVALAMAITYRHAAKGGWCDDVAALVRPVVEGDPLYWATLVDRQRELRCTGQSGHADAELLRLAKDPAGQGFADGVLARLDHGYIKDDLPDLLKKVWTDEPFRLDAAAAIWRDGVAGPGKPAAKRIAKDALDKAVAGTDPVVVHAALLAYAKSGQDKDRDAAAARLKALDAAADPSLVRSVDTLSDPALYATIDACAAGIEIDTSLKCLEAVNTPPLGSITAYLHYVRKALYDGRGDKDLAYGEARAAYEADPAHVFDARTFARLAAQRHEDLDLGLVAIGTVLAGRTQLPLDAMPLDRRAVLAKDLEIEVELLRALGRPAEAVDPVLLAQQVEPTPSRGLLVGMVYAEAGRVDEAALMLAYAMVTPIEDTARVTAARDVLSKAAAGWLPGDHATQSMIDAAGRQAADKGPPHPLLDTKLVDPALLPTPVEGAKTPGVRVIATWASWRPDSVEAVSRLATLAAKYADQGVTMVALDVDAGDIAAPVVTGLELRHPGPSAMRALRSVAIPTVLVVDPKGKVVAALSPYDRGTLDLETALDAVLPKAP